MTTATGAHRTAQNRLVAFGHSASNQKGPAMRTIYLGDRYHRHPGMKRTSRVKQGSRNMDGDQCVFDHGQSEGFHGDNGTPHRGDTGTAKLGYKVPQWQRDYEARHDAPRSTDRKPQTGYTT